MRLAADRQHLEKECDILQDEWQEVERNYHYLTNANEIVKANLEKVQMENNWRNGVEKMLPDFKSLHDLYQNKLVQQENLAKQLRIEQRSLKENESEHMKQVRCCMEFQAVSTNRLVNPNNLVILLCSVKCSCH